MLTSTENNMNKFTNGEWTEGTPSSGDKVQYISPEGGVSETYYSGEVLSIRKITKRSFMQRFDQTERIAIRNSTDDVVIDIHEDLKMASNVDLDLVDTVNAVAYLDAQGLLTVKTQADLLRDGTEDERY